MADIPRTLPKLTPENAHFWQGGARGQLQVLQCCACEFYIHPPSPVCPSCLSSGTKIASLSGNAKISAFTINYQPWRPGLRTPYVVAIVELPEQAGLRLTTNMVNCDPGDVRAGMAVQVCFEQHDDVWLPLFEPAPPP